jgi:redox-sensitive bicupin YhaK (pirin superfamily)
MTEVVMSAVKETFPLGMPWQTLDPFLFCVYHKDDYPTANGDFGPNAPLTGRNIGQDFANVNGWNMYHGDTIPGFPAHPHRGFETITVVNQGLVDHADSLGAAGRYGGGDTQWMTAGSGVQHSEMFPLLNKNEDNPLVLFQIWINLPSAKKMVDPHFGMLWREDIPVLTFTDTHDLNTTVQVVAGQLGDEQPAPPPPDSWAADENNHVSVWNIKIEPNGEFMLPKANEGLNRVLYFYKGDNAQVDGQTVLPNTGVHLESHVDVQLKAGTDACEFLLLQGKPINEPVMQYGPFVMNSENEIRQAYADFQKTQFGGWPWPKRDHVHADAEGRFAKHADGRLEVKS